MKEAIYPLETKITNDVIFTDTEFLTINDSREKRKIFLPDTFATFEQMIQTYSSE